MPVLYEAGPASAQVAQSVEQRIENPRVGSSILSLGTIIYPPAGGRIDDAKPAARQRSEAGAAGKSQLWTETTRLFGSLEKPRVRSMFIGLSLALGATAGGMTVATGLQCSGEAMAQVSTSFVQIGPSGTSARISD